MSLQSTHLSASSSSVNLAIFVSSYSTIDDLADPRAVTCTLTSQKLAYIITSSSCLSWLGRFGLILPAIVTSSIFEDSKSF